MNLVKIKLSLLSLTDSYLTTPNSSFCSMKRLRVFLPPLDEMQVHHRVTPRNKFTRNPHLGGERQCKSKVSCMRKNTTQLPLPELEPRPLNPEVQHTYHQSARLHLHGRHNVTTLILNSMVILITVRLKQASGVFHHLFHQAGTSKSTPTI